MLRSATQTRATYGDLCGMPACRQAVGCGFCDTPELWRGATGLCARVRACAGATKYVHTYTHTCCAVSKSKSKQVAASYEESLKTVKPPKPAS